MNEQLLEQVAKMLRAQLKGAGHLWWIGGYVYGVTSNGDIFVILYPADEKLQEKVVRVYPHDFGKLPAFIPLDVDGGDTEANPNKEQARKKGIYHECPLFEIVTFDGKETQMGRERRFGDVLRVSQKGATGRPVGQGGGQQPQAATRPPQGAPQAQQGPSREPTPPAQQQAQAQRPTTATPPDEPGVQGALGGEGLPDFRAMAVNAKTGTEFDYAAYMVLRNGLFTDQERIGKTRLLLAADWTPSAKANGAMLVALGTYRDKRAQAEGRGEAAGAAHAFAKREAVGAYHRELTK